MINTCTCCIGGSTARTLAHGFVQVEVRSLGDHMKNKSTKVEAIVLSRISSELPASLAPFNHEWKHLKGLTFVQIVLYGRRKGPSGSPCTTETCFGWVLAGATLDKGKPSQGVCYLSTTTGDEELEGSGR